MIRKIAITFIALASFIAAQGCRSINSDMPAESSSMVSRSYNNLSSDFSALDASVGFEVEYTVGPRAKVDVSCSQNVADRLIVEVKNGCLTLGLKKKTIVQSLRNVKIKARVTGPALTAISASSGASVEIESNMSVDGSPLALTASSGGSIEFDTPIRYSALTITSSSAADIELSGVNVTGDVKITSSSGADVEVANIQAAAVAASVSSGADVELSGKTGKVNFTASSGGSIKAGNLTAETATASASSGASISTDAKTLSKSTSSGGSVKNKQKS